MSFYQILFSVLFLAACREAFQTFPDINKAPFKLAATVSLLIFNDILYTSHEIELDNIFYSIPMKIVDLFNFLILATAIILLNPNDNILFVKRKEILSEKQRETWFWCLICAYWILALVWDLLGNIYSNESGLIKAIPYLLLLPFLSALFLTRTKLQATLKWNQTIILIILIIYILLFKPFIYPYFFKQ